MRITEISVKTIILSLLLCFGMGARADNVVTISSPQGAPGEEVSVSISLTNSDAVSSLQVSIPMDENLTLVEGSGQLGSRCSGHSLTVGINDGALQVFIYSMNMAAISGNSGEVATFKVKLGNQPKTVSLSPTKTVLMNTSGMPVTASTENGSVTIKSAKAEYSMMEVDFGEVPIRSTYTKTVRVTNVGNADLVISSLEFSDVNVFSTTTTLPLTVSPGGSGELNITYVPVNRGSIERTLKVGCNSSSKLNTIKLKAQPFAVNELHVQPVSGISDEEVTVPMTMNNMDAISGYQVEFVMPEQLEFVEGSFALSDRKQDHTSAVSLNEGVLRIIVYSQNDKPLTGDDGEIGSFKVKLVGRNSVELKPSKAVLSATIDNKVENVISAVYGGQVTISSPRISTDNSLDFGAVSITENAEKTLTVRNYGSAPLTISRVVFDSEDFSIKESLPITIETYRSQSLTVVCNSVEQTSFETKMQIYSNDPDLRMKEVKVTGSRFAPNYFTISTPDVTIEENLSINISVNTYDAISGVQFDLVYPEQYYEPFDDNFILEDRAKGMTVTSRQTSSNTLKYFCYFLSGGSIAAGEGKVLTIQMKPKGESVPVGTYKVNVKDIKLGTSELADKYAGADGESSFKVYVEEPVTITAKSYTIAYGDDLPNFEYETSGATLVGIPEISCEATATSPVGIYDILISKGSVTNNKDTYVNGTLTITKAPLKIKAGTYTRKQGEENPEFTLTYEGFKNGEGTEVLTAKPTATTTATKESAPGDYAVNVSGAVAGNYEISYVPGTLTVTEADPVTVTAKSYTRFYGEANPSFGYDSEGATLVGIPEVTCAADATSPVGTYEIVVNKGSVSNYNVTYEKGTLTIKKAPLTIKAGTYARKQGEDNPVFPLEYEGFKNGETADVLTKKPEATCEATKDSPTGDYVVTVSGGEAENYDISYVPGTLKVSDADVVILTAVSCKRVYGDSNPTFEFISSGADLVGTPEITCEATATSDVGTYPIVIKKGTVSNYNVEYVEGKLTITKAPLTVKADNQTRKQGEENPEFTVTYDGFKNEETETVLTKKPTVACEATKESAPGDYAITVGGAEAKNYEISYEPGTLTVVAADGVVVKAKSYTRYYGEANPVFEYETEGAELIGTPKITCAADAKSAVGTYDIIIEKGGVTNYNDKYVKGTLTIKKAPLTIKAGEYTRKQGEKNPEFTLTYEGFKNDENEDVLTKKPEATCEADEDSEAGEYKVTVSGAEAQNYEITYKDGVLTVIAPEQTIIKGDANGDGTVNAADIVEVVNFIMGHPSAKFKEDAADANGDGVVNAADIVAIVNIIMGN